ncbi:MAG: NAD-dependent epimerase/dehydratase family protein [Bauldia sp.]
MDATKAPVGGRVLVTGANGFIGSGVVAALVEAGRPVRAATRGTSALPPGIEGAVIGDLRTPTNLSEALHGVEAVVHTAGLAHEKNHDEAALRAVNAEATAKLARAARAAGVKTFVLLSSIRAQSGPSADHPLTEDDPAAPTDAYGRSKREAEELLAASGAPFVVLRPVLVHGPGMRFNMAALAGLAARGAPLPLARFGAARSIVARRHLADAVLLAIRNPAMAGATFIVADPEPLTVGRMIAALRKGKGRRAGLFPLPDRAVAAVARLAGRAEEMERLRQPLVASPARLLAAGWRPRRSAFDALVETGAGRE